MGEIFSKSNKNWGKQPHWPEKDDPPSGWDPRAVAAHWGDSRDGAHDPAARSSTALWSGSSGMKRGVKFHMEQCAPRQLIKPNVFKAYQISTVYEPLITIAAKSFTFAFNRRFCMSYMCPTYLNLSYARVASSCPFTLWFTGHVLVWWNL